jgi:hypothetical protein
MLKSRNILQTTIIVLSIFLTLSFSASAQNVNYLSIWNRLSDNQKGIYADSVARVNGIRYLSNELGDDFFEKNLRFCGLATMKAGGGRCVFFEIVDNKCISGRTLVYVSIPKWNIDDSFTTTITKQKILNCINNCDSCKFLMDSSKAMEIAKSVLGVEIKKYNKSSIGIWGDDYNYYPQWIFQTTDNSMQGYTITIDADTGKYEIGGWDIKY